MYKKHKWLSDLRNLGAFNQVRQICDLTVCFKTLNLPVRSGGFVSKRKFGSVQIDK